MQAVILAGGRGVRLGSLTKDTPKVMLPINGKPVLQLIIEHVKSYGFKDIILSTYYLSKVIEDYFGNGNKFGVRISYVVEDTPLGTAGALKEIKNLDQEFLVLYGDVAVKVDINKLLFFHHKNNGIASIVLQESGHPEDSDIVLLDKEKKVKKLIHKPGSDRYGNLTNAAMYILNKKILNYIKKGIKQDLAKDIFPALIKNNEHIYGYFTKEYIEDMGTPERLKRVTEDLNPKKTVN